MSDAQPESAVDEAFAANVKATRERLGWSQGELARRVSDAGWTNFHQTTISRIEKAERAVRLSEAQGIADVLRTTVDRLLQEPKHVRNLRRLTDAHAAARRAMYTVGGEIFRFELAQGDLAKEVDYMTRQLDKIADEKERKRVKQLLEGAQPMLTLTLEDIHRDVWERPNTYLSGGSYVEHEETP